VQAKCDSLGRIRHEHVRLAGRQIAVSVGA
jgi:hypothetical protein